MNRGVTYHPLVQKDFNEILAFYEANAGQEIADRFENEFRLAILAIREQPRHFPFYLKQRFFRRFRFATFPHLILYMETAESIRIMVLKHVRRASNYGIRRR